MAAGPNQRLERVMLEAGLSRKSLARMVRSLSGADGVPVATDHTAVGRWLDGTVPRQRTVSYILQALSSRLGRTVTPADIGMQPQGRVPGELSPTWASTSFDLTQISLASAPRLGLVVTTPESVAYFAHCLGDHYRADNLLGPAVLLPAVRGHLLTLEQMRASAGSPLLRQVLQVGAGYAEFAGWLSQDAGDAAQARGYYSLAHEWAEAAGDRRMASFVLMRRSAQAVTQGDGAYAANLAQAAQRDRSPMTARVRALAAQTEALGHAVTGDASEAARALDRAETLTAEAATVPAAGDPSNDRYCALPLYLRISRAKVALNLGDGEQAIRAFSDVLQALPVEYRRDRGQYLARIAQASVLAGLPEQASAHALESLAIARETGSTRTIDDIRALAVRLDKRWSSLAEVSLLRDSLNLSPAP